MDLRPKQLYPVSQSGWQFFLIIGVSYPILPRPENGGKYCVGERKRFKSCNSQVIPVLYFFYHEIQITIKQDSNTKAD